MAKNFKEGDSVIIVGFDLARMGYCLEPINGVITNKRRKYFTVKQEDGKEVECEISNKPGNDIGNSSGGGWLGQFRVYLSQSDLVEEQEIAQFLTADVISQISFEEQLNAVAYIKGLIEKTKK